MRDLVGLEKGLARFLSDHLAGHRAATIKSDMLTLGSCGLSVWRTETCPMRLARD
jgi:hypothetical protein